MKSFYAQIHSALSQLFLSVNNIYYQEAMAYQIKIQFIIPIKKQFILWNQN
jgi:hypothetical protein